MTPSERTALLAEIQTGPFAATIAPFIASGNDGAIVDALNAKTASLITTVSHSDFAIWAGQTGLRSAIQDHATNSASPLRSIALTILDFIQGGVPDNLNLRDARVLAMIDAWVAAGALTAQQKADLLLLGSRPVSRAEMIWGRDITTTDVAQTLRP